MKKQQSIPMRIWKNHYFRFVLFGLALTMLVPAVSGGMLKTSFLGIVGGTIIFTVAALGLNLLLGYSGLSDALLQKYVADSAPLWENGTEALESVCIGSVIGTHAGPGAVVAAFFRRGGK